MGRVIHFEVHADNPERAIAFYREVFGWAINRTGDMDYWLIETGHEVPGIDGAIMPRNGDRPATGAPIVGAVNTIQVDDLDAKLAKAIEHGGDLALDKMVIPGVGTVAYVHDSEANVVGMLQPEG
jgi:predicted enzyme related to lactoylglutathione lyase